MMMKMELMLYSLKGSILGEDINMVYVMACAANPPASTSDFKGYLEIMQGIALVKLPDGDKCCVIYS